MKIAEYLLARPNRQWALAKQMGVTHAVCRLPFDEPGGFDHADFMALLHIKQRFEDAGIKLEVVEPAPPNYKIKLGLPGRDEEIDKFCTFLRNMGAVGIPVLCYNFMAQFGWFRTSTAITARGGAYVTGYDHSLMNNAPLTEAGIVTEEKMWDNLEYFLKRVVPVAEEAKVKLGLHPDDPPISPIRGIARILTSADAFKRVIDMVPSDYNGITFCQGCFATMGEDIPSTIKYFGERKKIFLVHFRDVYGTPECFHETFHDDGKTNMVEAVRAYREIGYDGPVRVDHVPTMEGEENGKPGYETMGRLYAIGYLKGLLEAIK